MDIREKSSNEKRFIDVDALLEKMKRTSRYFDVVFDVEEMPTVDAVEVVRCRECVGRPFWEEDHNGVPVCLLSGLYVRSEDDFCSFGERTDGVWEGASEE